MRAVVQRVSKCTVTVGGEVTGSLDNGLLVYLGVGDEDTGEDLRYIAEKIINLRIYEDSDGKMNLSVSEMDGYGLCVVSQFTLYGDARKGRRPSYSHAADPATGERMYDDFIRFLKERGFTAVSGRFRQFMEVQYKNMGPITILLDSKKQF